MSDIEQGFTATDRVTDVVTEDLMEDLPEDMEKSEEVTEQREVENKENTVEGNSHKDLSPVDNKKVVQDEETVDPSTAEESNLTNEGKRGYESDYSEDEEVDEERVNGNEQNNQADLENGYLQETRSERESEREVYLISVEPKENHKDSNNTMEIKRKYEPAAKRTREHKKSRIRFVYSARDWKICMLLACNSAQ